MAADPTTIHKGMFLTSTPVNPTLTKVHTAHSVEELDERFDEAARLQALLAKTKAAIEALKSGSKP
jgi:hypothetical protein